MITLILGRLQPGNLGSFLGQLLTSPLSPHILLWGVRAGEANGFLLMIELHMDNHVPHHHSAVSTFLLCDCRLVETCHHMERLFTEVEWCICLSNY